VFSIKHGFYNSPNEERRFRFLYGATAGVWDGAVGCQWSIEFDNVYFTYDERREVLSNFSLTMRPGETVALVGPSGSGKSTVARLLCLLYDPTIGSVLIAGRDLRHVTLS
jgi:ABC-type multidrug transport system fused ATPase/permease subunit